MHKMIMSYLKQLVVWYGVLLWSLACANDHSLPNLTLLKQQLVQYHDSGLYFREIGEVIAEAKLYMLQRLKQGDHFAGKRPALVLDIDETALSNYPLLVSKHFCVTTQDYQHYAKQATAEAILPTLVLYRFAQDHHIAVLFITARRAAERQATIANLHKAGYRHWDALILKDQHDASAAAEYKRKVRQHFIAQGYDIIANIGDQVSDLAGGYADQVFKLPNPYYWFV